jgi:hypothetical protein
MTEPLKPIIARFCDSLFEKGLETYDGNNPVKESRAGNIGGAKLFFHIGWKSATSDLIFNDPVFGNVLKEFPAVLYVMNRVEFKNNEPVMLKDGSGYNRKNSSLMLYMQFDEDPNCGKNARLRILEAMKEAKRMDLSSYIEVASEIDSDKLKVLETMTIRDVTGTNVPLKMHAAIIIALPSGAEGSSQIWSIKAKAKTREQLASKSTASEAEMGDIPF